MGPPLRCARPIPCYTLDVSHRPPAAVRRVQRTAMRAYLESVGHGVESASVLMGVDAEEFRAIASGHLSVRFWHVVRMESVLTDPKEPVATRWFRLTGLLAKMGEFELARSRSHPGRAHKWKNAPAATDPPSR